MSGVGMRCSLAGSGAGAYWEGSTGQGTRRREAEEDSGGWFPQYLRSRGW
jgi:hypothetical protein